MDLHNSSAFTRRQFLGRGLTLASAAVTVPWFLNSSALALPIPAFGLSAIPGIPEDRILVVVQLSGGNDGLNMVVPFAHDAYYKARPGIAIPAANVLKFDKNQTIGLHPQLAGIKELYDNGLCTLIQGVGYPNPNRSHFKSMDIWHTADTSATGNGWLGRYFDSECCGFGKGESGRVDPAPAGSRPQLENTPGVAIGRTAPLAMQGQQIKPVSFETADLFRWIGQDIHADLNDPYHKLSQRDIPEGVDPDSNTAFLMRTALDAQVSSDLIRKAVRQRPLAQYPGSELARQLAMVAAMIRSGLPTRVYYVNLGGFDTHAQQGGAQGRHAQLMGQFSGAIKAFYADLKASEQDQRVLTMSFSEFGRRVGQNASQGTDHGTAAPMMLFGPMVRPGIVGEHPSLTDLDEGDLKHRIDFRSVYSGILSGWLKGDPRKILRGEFRAVPLIKA